MKLNRQFLLKTAFALPFAVGIAARCDGEDHTLDVASYLETQCTGTNLNLERAKFEIDLVKGQKIKVDDYKLTTEGSGRISIHIPDNTQTEKQIFSSNGDEVYLKERGIEYAVTSTSSEAETTRISVSRSCERS